MMYIFNIKTLTTVKAFFVHSCSSAGPEIIPMASKTADHSFNSINTKRFKTGQTTT